MKQVVCFGDSNTWGLIPGTKERYSWGERWTSILQEQLKNTYRKIASAKGIHFGAASDYVKPSPKDQEHLDVDSHGILADAVYSKLKEIM